jgi:hypothetical protein
VLDGLKAHTTVAAQQAKFTIDSSVSSAYIQARGTVNLNPDYDATANIDTRAVDLGPLWRAICLDTAGTCGETELHAWLKGPLKRPSGLRLTWRSRR